HVGVDVGGVEERDAEVDRLVDHLARGFEVGALAEIVAATADGGNAQAGAAEIANLHEISCEAECAERGAVLWPAGQAAARRAASRPAQFRPAKSAQTCRLKHATGKTYGSGN